MARIGTPIWYGVHTHTLSFKDAILIDSLPIFIMSVINRHDPYVAEKHVLLETGDGNFMWPYIYWSYNKEMKNETFINGAPPSGTFGGSKYGVPEPGDVADVAYSGIVRFFHQLFGVNIDIDRPDGYTIGNMEQLQYTLTYASDYEETFNITHRNIDSLYRASGAHHVLGCLKGMLNGQGMSRFFRKYRDDPVLFRRIVDSYWPKLLYSLYLERSFDTDEQEYIDNAHARLYSDGDTDFYIYYVECFSETFADEEGLVETLKRSAMVSNEGDANRVKGQLLDLDPDRRKRYILQEVPVSDEQVESLHNDIVEHGVDTVISRCIDKNHEQIDRLIEMTRCTLNNDKIMSTMVDIYRYPPEELVYTVSGKGLYIFLRGEVARFDNGLNPYDRQQLPEYIFRNLDPDGYSCKGIEELWSDLLRREINI